MLSLAPYVGRSCIVQFANNNVWLSCHIANGGIGLSLAKDKESGKETLIPAPFVIGKIVRAGERWGYLGEDDLEAYAYAIEITQDEGIVELALNTDAILSVATIAEALEPKKKSGLILP